MRQNSGKSDLQPLPGAAPVDISKMTLTPGSAIDLHVFEEPDLDGKYRLDQGGNVALPLLGPVRLEGLTLRECEAAISRKLIESQILKVANVVVDLDEISVPNVTVSGEVVTPGNVMLLGPRRLVDVLSLAGGETQFAGSEIIIQHKDSPSNSVEIVKYDRTGNDQSPLGATVNPGDSVFVKRAGIVYVLGAVNRPGGYVMQESGNLNVDQALALAMGTAVEAKTSDIRVFRKIEGGGEVEIPVNYKKINNGKAIPIALSAQDIVYVPPSRAKEIFLRGGTSVFNAAATAIIYNQAY